MLKVSSLILENKRGEILLLLRDDKLDIPYPNHWDLIGGHVEKRETTDEALVREVKEETGYELKEYSFWKEYPHSETDPEPNTKYIYRGSVTDHSTLKKGKEGQELRFFPLKEALDLRLASNHRAVLQDYIKEFHPEL